MPDERRTPRIPHMTGVVGANATFWWQPRDSAIKIEMAELALRF